uniref:Uncharacterized protein n=1 Tax=Micrurus spixii TaxID=129469 RepID=A0A2D4LRY6_9SAUR
MALLMLFTLKATQDKIQIGINRDTQQKPLNKNHKASSMARTTEHSHTLVFLPGQKQQNKIFSTNNYEVNCTMKDTEIYLAIARLFKMNYRKKIYPLKVVVSQSQIPIWLLFNINSRTGPFLTFQVFHKSED